MAQFIRLTFPGLLLALVTFSPGSYASCWNSGTGPTAIYRHPSVPAEFKNSALVIFGRVTGKRNISEPDDPEGYSSTIYTVQVLETFKGTPQRTIRLKTPRPDSPWIPVKPIYCLSDSPGLPTLLGKNAFRKRMSTTAEILPSPRMRCRSLRRYGVYRRLNSVRFLPSTDSWLPFDTF